MRAYVSSPTDTYTIDWTQIDTVFLDMDGTLLDLNYDNRVWSQAVPAAYARHHALPEVEAHAELFAHMQSVRGSIDFYSFDYWAEYTGLDMVAVHRELAHLVAYRPGAETFLAWLRQSGKQAVLATNAHPSSVLVKDEQVQISAAVDSVVSSDAFKAPKEDLKYWEDLQSLQPFDPTRALFIDDNKTVLDAAAKYGIAHLLTIRTPDSERPARVDLEYPAFDHFDEIRPVPDK